MKKLNKNYFDNQEVILIGLSENEKTFSRMVYKILKENNVTSYPINIRENTNFPFKVYKSIVDVPNTASIACILTKIENNHGLVELIIETGVKKVLLRNMKQLNEKDINTLKEANIELTVGCPNMVLGKGLHKLHGLLAGIK